MSHDKYSNYTHHNYSASTTTTSPYRKRYSEKEIDPYAPTIVEELLQNGAEWKDVNDVVRITFKALTDVVRAQGETLKELEKQVPLKASKVELTNGLSTKVNIADFSKTIAELGTSVNNKVSSDEIKIQLRDYTLRSELQYALGSKPSFEEVRDLIQHKPGTLELRSELSDVAKSLTDKLNNLEARMNGLATQKEIANLKAVIDSRSGLNTAELNEILEGKANKQSVANALQKKANRADVDTVLSQKLDKTDALELEHRIDQLTKRLDSISFKKEDLHALMQDLNKKVDKTHFEMASDAIARQKNDFQKIKTDFESVFELVKNDLENVRQVTAASLNKKIDIDEFDRILQILNRKPDIDQVNGSLIKLREEVSEEIAITKEEIVAQVREIESDLTKKASQTQSLYEDINQEVRELNDQIYKTLDEKIGKKQIEDFTAYIKKTVEALQKDFAEEGKLVDEKLNQLKLQKDAQNEELSTYVKKVAEAVKREATEQIRELEGEINKVKASSDTQIEETSKITKKFAQELQQELYSELQQIEDKFNEMKTLRDSHLEDTTKNVKKSLDILKQELYAEVQRVGELYNQLRGQISDMQRSKPDTAALEAKLQQQLDNKIDLNEVQEALNTFSTDVSRKFSNMKEDFTQLIKVHEEEVLTALKKKASVADMNNALSKLESSIHNLSEKAELTSEKALKAHERQANEGSLNYIKQQIEELQRDVILKANIEDVVRLLDSKANAEDLSKFAKQFRVALDEKATQEELRSIVSDQALINESLCTENILARWAWRTGELSSRGLVPWDMQMTNTLPDNFLWEKGVDCIVTVAPGLYEIAYGFFTDTKPGIKVLVNDEVVVSSWQPEKSQKSFEIPKMRNKESITGLTGVDYLILPARAKVAINYVGDPSGEGFLSLKRL